MSSMVLFTPDLLSRTPQGWAPAHPHWAGVEAFGASHRGLVREHNEDAFIVAPDVGLFAVSDGMGGAAAGEVASRMAIETVRAVFEDPDLTWPRGLPRRPDAGLPLLVSGVEPANARVHATACGDLAKEGMGATFTGLLLLRDRFALAHVGDSRAYLLRDRRLHRLTVDHTLVQALVEAGAMTPEEAEVSNVRHVLSRAVGTSPSVHVDRRLVSAQAGDTVLLSSDGLHGVISDGEIETILLSERDLKRAANSLIERACDAGGPDNVSVVLVRVTSK